MKIKHYNDAIDWFTRPKFNGGGSVKNKEVLPKRKPEEELKKRKRKRFEKLKEYLENPEEVEEMLELRDGGRINKVPKGFVDGQKFANLLVESGFDVSNIKAERGLSQSLSRLAELYDIEKILGPGNKFYYKVPSKKNLEEIIISRAGPKARVPIAKKLIKDLNIKSQTQLAKAMKARGYAQFSADFMKKNFPEIKGVSFVDPKFVPPMKKDSSRTVLNQIRYDLRKTMSSIPTENFLRDFKKAKNYGSSVQTMHTTAKRKKTGLINIDDLAFGSKVENEAYAQGLDRFRSGLVTTLSNIKNKFSNVKPNEIIDVPVNLQTEYNFPKKMKLKELVDRVNVGLTDLAFKTDGKVRGELLEINNKGVMKFVDNPIKNYKIIPGGGLLEGTTKKFGPLLKKFRVDEKGTMILDEKGSPILKKGQTLTQAEAEKVLSITETMKEQLPEAAKSRPVSLKEGKSLASQLNARLPIIQTMYDVAKSIPDDIGRAKYLSAGFKVLGLAVAPYVAYTTYQDLKAGKNLLETLETNLIGTNIIGGTKDLLAMTPEERKARAKVKQERIAELNIDMPTGFGFIEAPPAQTDMSLEEAKQKFETAQQRVAKERAERDAGVAAVRKQTFENLRSKVTDTRPIAIELAGGGLLKQAGKRSGPPPEKGPGGLASLEDYARTMME